jgi:hypothetical protein
VTVADLLIHSMAEFGDVILGALQAAGARDVVEIGSEGGVMTRALLDWTAARGGSLVSVDPAPASDVRALFAGREPSRLIAERSLQAIPGLDADAWLVDGDHNWWTVRHECEAIGERSRANGRPLLAFFHDVGWPWARRDLYYDPSSLPPEAVRPHTYTHGVTLDDPGVVPGGFRGEGAWACALREGGPRNGVLTAIEDFVEGRGTEFVWANVPAVFGLGVLWSREAPWSEALGDFLRPLHDHPLLARLEENRLRNYLRVIELQDASRAAA